MLFIEEEVLSPTNLSPMLLELGKGHKSDGDVESSQSTSQVYILAYSYSNLTFECIVEVAYRVPLNPADGGWFDGLIGCFKPMWMIMGKTKSPDLEKGNFFIFVFKSLNLYRITIFPSYMLIMRCILQPTMGKFPAPKVQIIEHSDSIVTEYSISNYPKHFHKQ